MEIVLMSIFLFMLGACLGSFYLVVGKRLPLGEKVINDRSMCDSCKHVLGFKDLFPIFSYLFLRGKCRYCKQKISPLNLIMELVCGSAFVFAYLFYGFGCRMFMFLIVFSLMLIIFVSDFLYYIINDSPLVVATFLSLILYFVYYDYKFVLSHLVSGLGLFATMYLIKLFGDFVFKRESLGGGDIKLAFVMGFILGFRLGLCALILSTFLALPYSYASLMLKKNNEVAFGPFLVASLFMVFAFDYKFLDLLNVFFNTL